MHVNLLLGTPKTKIWTFITHIIGALQKDQLRPANTVGVFKQAALVNQAVQA